MTWITGQPDNFQHCGCSFHIPSLDNFKAQFFRDFPYQNPSLPVDLNFVQDQDIIAAKKIVHVNFNCALFSTQCDFEVGYNLLTAHYMVLNIRQSSQGLSGQFNFTQASKGAGSVNESFSIPERIMENPELSMLAKTNYGAQFLLLVLPQLTGQIFNAFGETHP